MFLTKESKSPYFQIVYFVDGKRTKKSTKKTNRKEAEKFLASFNPGNREVVKLKKTSVMLSSFVSEYKTYIGNTYSKKYLIKAVTPSFNRLKTHISDIPLQNITSRDIDQFISSVASKARFAASLYHRTLKAAFNKAVVWNYIQENPFNKIKSPKVSKSLPVFISEAELIQIINKTESQLFKDIYVTAFYTGMRLGELLNMKWNWVDFSQDIITVKNSEHFKTKNKRERVIPIHSKVKQILLSRFPIGKGFQNNFVFSRYEGVKLNESYISKRFKKAVRLAKLNEKIHFHSLRHSFASALVQRSISLYTVKELLGHENIRTTQVYSHLTSNNLKYAIDLL